MYEVPPDPPQKSRIAPSSELGFVLVLGAIIATQIVGEAAGLIVGALLAALWYLTRDEIDRRFGPKAARAWAARSPRTILDPSTWAIILALLALLSVSLLMGGH